MARMIDADKLKREVEGLPNCYNGFSDTYDKACIIGLIDEMPTIEPKHGRWLPSKDGHGCECSECGTAYRWSEADTMIYCPSCGARMDAQIGEDKSHPFAESVMMGMDGVRKE